MIRLKSLLIKEIIQIRRDPRLFGILVAVPIFQIIVFGFAAVTDIKEIDILVRDRDRSHQSREYIRALEASDYFQVTYLSGPDTEEEEALVSGSAGMVLVIPEDFEEMLARGRPVDVQVLVDGSDSNFASLGAGYMMKATKLFSERLVRPVVQAMAARQGSGMPTVSPEARIWYNADLNSTWHMVPGVMGVLLLVTTMIVTSMALVKEREVGTLEQLIVTPLRPSEMIAGKLLPFVAIGFVEVTLALLPILAIFRVPFRGNLLTFYVISGLFLLTTLGLGLLISTFAKTQQQAMWISAFFVMMPFVLLSGFIFPIENMPKVIQVVTYAIPLRYFLTAIRGIFLKGNSLAVLWPEALTLAGLGLLILGGAILRFRKRLD